MRSGGPENVQPVKRAAPPQGEATPLVAGGQTPKGNGYIYLIVSLAPVNSSGKILHIDRTSHQMSAEAWLEETRAEAKLAQMDLAEDLGVLSDSEECPRLRRTLAEQYRQVIGVAPQYREQLRIALERVKAGGGMPVADVVDLMEREYHANGSV